VNATGIRKTAGNATIALFADGRMLLSISDRVTVADGLTVDEALVTFADAIRKQAL
tara:strand:+ start:603 stop:770 length:168 start_codon:yes stop_codon:yes gene_type:complete